MKHTLQAWAKYSIRTENTVLPEHVQYSPMVKIPL
jgi:hypothetical protein